MNNLSKQTIKEFQEAYFKDFGMNITEEEALDMAISLAEIFSIIYKPIKPKPHEK